MSVHYLNFTGFPILMEITRQRLVLKKEKQGYKTKKQSHKGQYLHNADIYVFRLNGMVVAIERFYEYKYPITQNITNIVDKIDSSGDNKFYDDTLDETLGGAREVLG